MRFNPAIHRIATHRMSGHCIRALSQARNRLMLTQNEEKARSRPDLSSVNDHHSLC